MSDDLRMAAQALLSLYDQRAPLRERPEAWNALRAALAQPQAPSVPAAWQERQARRMRDGVVTEWGGWYECRSIDKARSEVPDHVPYEWRPLYTAPQVAQEAAPTDPMDWPLPCDVVVGHGTMRKGVRLGAMVSRMKALYEMATGQNADEVAGRSLEQRMAAPGLLQQADAAQEAAGAVAPVIAGALFDFLGYITSRDESLTVGSREWATPAVDALEAWAKTRNLDLTEARVRGWRAALAAAPAEPIPTRATLIAALQWYADGLHFDKASPDAWDTVSGEPQNWWCDEAGTATIEDGSIAAMTLRGELTAEQLQEFEAGEAAAPVGLDAKAATERDAARYRWLRSTTNWASSKGERVDVRNNPELWDSAIDAALAAAPQAQAAPPATEVQP